MSAELLDAEQVIAGFLQKRVLLIGDAILDATIYGHALGISTETPTVVASEKRTEYTFGGASLVARNLLELGASVNFITVLGNDETRVVYESFKHPSLSTSYLIEPGCRNTVKKRFWIDGYKLLQLDIREDRPISTETVAKVFDSVTKQLNQTDILVMADNRHGLLTDGLISQLLDASREARIPTYVDSQVAQRSSNHHLYQGADVVCCNLVEARAIAPHFNPDNPGDGLCRIQKTLNAGVVVVKLGAQGCLALADGHWIHQEAYPVNAIDPCGAGDAFFAALALVQGLPWPFSLKVANYWAALSTEQRGPNPPQREALMAAMPGLVTDKKHVHLRL